MIGLKELTEDIALWLSDKTGVAASNGRPDSPVYPCLLVTANGKSCGIAVCGRQVERKVSITVTCYPSRRRERPAGLALADRVYGLLAGGFTACGRGFHPGELTITTDHEERVQVTGLLEFFDLPGDSQSGGNAAEAQLMGSLALRVGQSKEEE